MTGSNDLIYSRPLVYRLAINWKSVIEIASAVASIIGVVLGGFGLAYSYLAAKRAQAAEQAAREARESVRRSNAGEELRELSGMAKELLRSVQGTHLEAAKLRSADLLAGIAQARHRWKLFLFEDSRARLDEAARLLTRISAVVSSVDVTGDPELNRKVLKSCHDVVILLADESGKLLEQLEAKYL